MELIGFIAFILYAVAEYVLGKTTLIEPNSTIDLVIGIVKKVLALLKEDYNKPA